MSKLMQKIVLFLEPNDDAFDTPFKIGHLFMNRFAVDEDAGFEILKVLKLGKSSWKMVDPRQPEYKNLESERQQKGMDLKHHVQLHCIINCELREIIYYNFKASLHVL